MKLLLVEDEVRVSSFIKRGLEEEGHQVIQAFDGKEGLRLAIQEDFDLIILDVVMPGMSGIELCDVLKNQYKLGVPILMLTALGATDDIVLGLETGADDYLSKPFKFKELLARIHALSRRTKSISKPETERLTVLDLEMDLQLREVRRAGVEIRLTAREFRLLEFLLRNKNRVVSRTQILEQVWGIDFDMGTNVIDVYINYLRKKIDRDHEEKIIRTVIGMGYIIKE